MIVPTATPITTSLLPLLLFPFSSRAVGRRNIAQTSANVQNKFIAQQLKNHIKTLEHISPLNLVNGHSIILILFTCFSVCYSMIAPFFIITKRKHRTPWRAHKILEIGEQSPPFIYQVIWVLGPCL